MKKLQIIAWLLVSLQLLLVLYLFIEKNAGDDAAGRGVATGYAILLLPLVLASAGLLYWSQNSESKVLQRTALCVVAFPFVILGGMALSNSMGNYKDRLAAAEADKFQDPHLTKIALAIDGKNYPAITQLLSTAKIDWTARNGQGATLLGHAIKRILADYTSGAPPIEALRILLANGAPLTANAIHPLEILMAEVIQSNSPGALDTLTVLLEAGADPNALDPTNLPLIHAFSCTVAKLKILATHGANLEARNNRVDRPGWSALMNAAYMREWDKAAFFLEKSVSVKYKAPDGNTLASILAPHDAEQAAEDQSAEPGYAHFMALLRKQH